MSTGSGTSDSVYTQNSSQSLWERYRIHQNVLHKQQINIRRSQSFSCQVPSLDETMGEMTGITSLAEMHDNHSSRSSMASQNCRESRQQYVSFDGDSDHVQKLCRTVSDNDDDASSSDEDMSDEVDSSNVFLKLGIDPTSHGRKVKTLTRIHELICNDCFLKGRHEPITLESSDSFFLIDGDSLLCEAMQTKSWKYGQQLHLFYIIELYIVRLQQHVGKCEIVFFDDMEKMWSKDVLMKTFRSALIIHLLKNSNLVVHKWGNIFSREWVDYVRKEQPSFIFVHSGYRTCMEIEILFTLIAYVSVTLYLDIAYTENILIISSKLNALYVKPERMVVRSLMGFLKRIECVSAWSYVTKCFPKIDHSNFMATKSIPETLGGIDAIFFESVHIYWENLTSSEQESYDEKHYICKWAHYFAVISLLTISERLSIISGCKLSRYSKASSSPKFSKFIGSIYHCLSNSKSGISISGGCLADLLDISLYTYLFYPGNVVSDICFKKQVIEKYHHLLSLWKSGDSFLDIFALPVTHADNISLSAPDQEGLNVEITLAVTHCRLSEEYAGEVKKTLIIDGNFTDIVRDCKGYAFDESYHWHSGKPLCDDIDRFKKEPLSKNPWVRKKQLMDIQKYMNFMTMYGESLGNGVKPLLIPSSAFSGRSKKKTDKKMGKTALAIIERNKERMKQNELKNVSTKWKFLLREIDQIEELETATKLVMKFVNSLDSEIGYEEPLSYLLKLQFKLWQKSCKEGNRSFTSAAELIHSMHKIIQTEGHVISDKFKKKVAGYFTEVGYSHVAQLLFKGFPHEKVSEEYFIGMPYNIFQMKYMGHLMKRNVRSDPDPRVEGFIPDTWQRELLDAIDNYESALVVAPTSSGKTFCSYYCMEKVLIESDDGIVVYVSPTKALVNQVHASIYSKFRKNLPDGQALVGVFTRDYEHDSMNCQILVTVPQCLEILLLSPKRQNWVSKIRYVILDEVHCIGGELGGEVWEHLITLIRCPFLALSATIGNPVEFHSWLLAVQEFKYKQEFSCAQETKKKFNMVNPKVKLVTYNERYSDIQTSIYVPETDDLVVTHPCMFLDGQTLQNKGFPSGMNLSPRETYELWLACMDILDDDDDDAKENLEVWCPTTYFGNKLFIAKFEARQYEICLKKYIYELIRNRPKRAAMLIRYFRDQLPIEKKGALDQRFVDIPGISSMEFDLIESFPQLIEKLRNTGKFPTLVFQCDRRAIEKLAKALLRHVHGKVSLRLDNMRHIVQRVEELESLLDVRNEFPTDVDGKYGKISSKIQDVIKHSGSAKAMLDSNFFEKYEQVHLYNEDTVSKKLKVNDKEKQQFILLKEELNRNRMKVDKVKNECSFISPAAVSAQYLEKVLEKVNDENVEDLIKHGISYHHGGCGSKFRRATEILFRCGYIQVVTSTSTLALGIHMPCKTVVIVGDDPYIDALAYRQMIGRSGRRGFDNIGNVVFYGVPVRKISTLIKADLPSLQGLYPISCTLILRLLLLVSNSNDEDFAHKKAMVLLSHPFFTHMRPTYQKQLQHFFLYATDHLIRQLMLDEKGVPLQFAGLVCHLHYKEPGNMLFVYLLRQGMFHDICKPTESGEHCHYGYRCKLCNISPIIGKMFQREGRQTYLCGNCFNSNSQRKIAGKVHISGPFLGVNPSLKYTYSEETLRCLVCILCHLFCEIEIANFRLVYDPRHINSVRLKRPSISGSKILLDPLPSRFFSAIKCYNDDVEVNFSKYLVLVGRSMKKESVVTLPLSCIQWTLFQTDEYIHTKVIDSIVSPFAQLSGCDNETVKKNCSYKEELFRTLRSDIFMDFKSNIPALRLDRNINAYALDFFKHRNTRALDNDNHVKKGDVFQLLKDFMLLIMTIATALKELGPEDDDDHVIWAFKHLAFEYRERFHSCFPSANIEF